MKERISVETKKTRTTNLAILGERIYLRFSHVDFLEVLHTKFLRDLTYKHADQYKIDRGPERESNQKSYHSLPSRQQLSDRDPDS